MRLVTDITKENLPYCKEIMKVAQVRHLEGIRGNFGVSETEYVATAFVSEKEKPLSKVIYSNVKEIVDQHSYLFETLWNKAALAEQRIAEIEGRAIAEKIEIFYGEQDAMKILLQAMTNVKREAVVCSDAKSPAFSMGVEPVKKGFIDFKKRGVKIRQIVEITKDNLEYCKEFMNYVELRHMDNVKGNMAVSETEYVATAVLEGAVPVTQTIFSNAKALLEQQRYFFENLWSKAIPAEEKIREIDEGIEHRQTVFLDSLQDISANIKKLIENSDELLVCSRISGLQMIYNHFLDSYKVIISRYREGKHKGIRWITTLDRQNIQLVKAFLDLGVQIRHLPPLPPMNFAVTNRDFEASISKMEGGKPVDRMLASNEQFYIDYYRAMFEELWNEAGDAAGIVRDIEKGIEQSKIEIIHNPKEALRRGSRLVSSSKTEVLLLFSTASAFRRQAQSGGLQKIQQAIQNGSKVRILIPSDESIEKTLPQIAASIPQVGVRSIDKSLETRLTVLVVDGQESLVFELKDDTAITSNDSIGIATYFDSKPIASSYAAIFESLWKQSELYEQVQAHDRLQREFINIAAHELRTPVQPILGIAEMIEDEVGEQHRNDIRVIARNARRLQHLTEDILDVTRIESKLLTLNTRRFNLNEILLSLIDDCRRQIAGAAANRIGGTTRRNVELIYDQKEGEDKFVYADKGRISQVISNLLGNAIKFTEEGEIEVKVEKIIQQLSEEEQDSKKKHGDSILVQVKDTGKGIDPEIMPKLFTKFATKSGTGGTGLGLFISKSIIEAHGGKIWVESNKDGSRGATFCFMLPVAPEESASWAS
jgi:two-component system sensor histidine kinase VicK